MAPFLVCELTLKPGTATQPTLTETQEIVNGKHFIDLATVLCKVLFLV